VYLYEGQWEQIYYIGSICYDILLASNDIVLLHDVNKFLSNKFEMKDIGKKSNMIGIKISRERSQRVLGLSQKGYIKKVLQIFRMESCSSGIVPIQKGDKYVYLIQRLQYALIEVLRIELISHTWKKYVAY